MPKVSAAALWGGSARGALGMQRGERDSSALLRGVPRGPLRALDVGLAYRLGRHRPLQLPDQPQAPNILRLVLLLQGSSPSGRVAQLVEVEAGKRAALGAEDVAGLLADHALLAVRPVQPE